jgi:hypothetical protein
MLRRPNVSRNAPGWAALTEEKRKVTKYRDQAERNHYHFIPFGVETYGAMGPSAQRFITNVMQHGDPNTSYVGGWSAANVGQLLTQWIQVALWEENAMMIIKASERRQGAGRDDDQHICDDDDDLPDYDTENESLQMGPSTDIQNLATGALSTSGHARARSEGRIRHTAGSSNSRSRSSVAAALHSSSATSTDNSILPSTSAHDHSAALDINNNLLGVSESAASSSTLIHQTAAPDTTNNLLGDSGRSETSTESASNPTLALPQTATPNTTNNLSGVSGRPAALEPTIDTQSTTDNSITSSTSAHDHSAALNNNNNLLGVSEFAASSSTLTHQIAAPDTTNNLPGDSGRTISSTSAHDHSFYDDLTDEEASRIRENLRHCDQYHDLTAAAAPRIRANLRFCNCGVYINPHADPLTGRISL